MSVSPRDGGIERPLGRRGPLRIWDEDAFDADPILAGGSRLALPLAAHGDPQGLSSLVRRVRADTGWLSLTAVVHAFDAAAAKAFVDELSRELHDPDAIVVTPSAPDVLDAMRG